MTQRKKSKKKFSQSNLRVMLTWSQRTRLAGVAKCTLRFSHAMKKFSSLIYREKKRDKVNFSFFLGLAVPFRTKFAGAVRCHGSYQPQLSSLFFSQTPPIPFLATNGDDFGLLVCACPQIGPSAMEVGAEE